MLKVINVDEEIRLRQQKIKNQFCSCCENSAEDKRDQDWIVKDKQIYRDAASVVRPRLRVAYH